MEKHGQVIVCGGGVSGCTAALAAARAGAKVLLTEQYGFLGGTLTNAGVGPMMTFHAGGRQVVRGIAQEIIDRLIECGGCIGHIEDTTGYASSVTPVDAEKLKWVLDEMMAESGVDVLFHAKTASARTENGVIRGVTVCTCGGLSEITGDVFVDATGDAVLSALAGAEIEKGRPEDGLCQPMTANMKLYGVDTDRIREEIRRRPENFNVRDLSSLQRSPRLSMAGFYEEFQKARAEGLLSTCREDVLLFETVNPGEVIVNTTRVIRCDAADPRQLSEAERQGRRQAYELYRFFRERCAGFENAVYVSTGVQIGIRESRRVMGDYVLCARDLLTSRHFEDTAALGGYPIDIHNPTGESTQTVRLEKGQFYYLPLRIVMAKGLENLAVAGRCVSCTHEAQAAIRVTPIAMAIGQAAGTLAGLAAAGGKALREVPYGDVRRELLARGAVLE